MITDGQHTGRWATRSRRGVFFIALSAVAVVLAAVVVVEAASLHRRPGLLTSSASSASFSHHHSINPRSRFSPSFNGRNRQYIGNRNPAPLRKRATDGHKHKYHTPRATFTSKFNMPQLSPLDQASKRRLAVFASMGLALQLASNGGSGVFGGASQFAMGSGANMQTMPLVNQTTGDQGYMAIIPGDSDLETVAFLGLYNFLNYYNFAIVARLLLTWFPNPPQFLVGPLAAICDPYLNLFRGIIPPLGQLDFSPIISIGLLNFITSSAAALPCEMPKGEQKDGIPVAVDKSSHPAVTNCKSVSDSTY